MNTNSTGVELPIIARRTLIGSGGSVMIALPSEWLKQKGLGQGDKVVLVANGNLTVFKEDPELIQKLSQKLNAHSSVDESNNGTASTQDVMEHKKKL